MQIVLECPILGAKIIKKTENYMFLFQKMYQ